MSRATVGALARREAVLLSFLAAATAVVLLADPLDAAWLRVAGAAVAAAGALLRLVIAVRRAALERDHEQVRLERCLRVPVASLGDIDPTLIGVDPAAQIILDGDELPEYVSRAADAEVEEAIGAALDGRGRWLVVVVGMSKVGKSRTLFESLRRTCGADVQLVAPTDGDALRSLLDPAQGLRLRDAPAVLWLDDLEPFLNQGVTLQLMQEWRDAGPSRIVVATYGGKGSEKIIGSGASGLATIASEVLQHAGEVHVETTTDAELGPLRSRVPEVEFAAIDRHGLAAYLVAGPALERKLTTGRHAPDEPAMPEGVAFVDAAVGWALCGRTDPVGEQTMRHLWSAALPDGLPATDQGFERGQEWACRPVAGTVALVRRAAGFQAFEYVVRLARDKPGAEPPGEEAWSAAIESAADVQSLAVASAASRFSCLDVAVAAFGRAQESSMDAVACLAGFNRAFTLGELGRWEEAVEACDQVVQRFGDDPHPGMRALVAKSLGRKGFSLGEVDRAVEGVAVYDLVVQRFGDDPHPAVRVEVARSLLNKGAALGRLELSEAVVAVSDELVERFGGDPDPALREKVARSLFNKAVALGELGRWAEVVAVSDEVVERFGGDPPPELREEVAMALFYKGVALGRLDRRSEGVAVYDLVVQWFGGDPPSELREKVARSLAIRGGALAERFRLVEAVEVCDLVVQWFGSDSQPELREQVATALINKGAALDRLDQPVKAVEVFDQVVERFGSDSRPELREQVATALFNKGVTLGRLDRLAEAAVAFGQVVERFGSESRPELREQVAMALYYQGVTFGRLDQPAEAMAAFDQVVARFGGDPQPNVREWVAVSRAARREIAD